MVLKCNHIAIFFTFSTVFNDLHEIFSDYYKMDLVLDDSGVRLD